MFSRIFNRRARSFAGIDFLSLVPVPMVESFFDADEQQVVLLIPRYRDPVFGRLLQPRLSEAKRHIRMKLDARGSWLWPLMDGERSIGQLAEMFERRFPEDAAESGQRISGYLYNLYEHELLKFNNLNNV